MSSVSSEFDSITAGIRDSAGWCFRNSRTWNLSPGSNEAYALGAYSFLIKTVDFEDAVAFAQSLTWYWSNIKSNGHLSMPPASWPVKESLAPYSGTAPSYPEPQPNPEAIQD